LRRALEQIELGDLARDARHKLHRTRARANHRDGLAGERVFMLPARRMELHALELIAARQIRNGWIVEKPDRGDEDRGFEPLAPPSFDHPRPALRIKGRARHLTVEAHVFANTVPGNAALDIGEDLVARRKRGRPLVILIIGEGIEP
jgi:hypothetical protein